MELAKRDDVPVELTWDLSLIYPTEEAMLADAQKMKELSLSMEAQRKPHRCSHDQPLPRRLPGGLPSDHTDRQLLRSRRFCRLLQQCKPDAQRPHQQPDL